MKAARPRTQVICFAIHPRCGYRTACTNARVSSYADLKSLFANMTINGKLQTIKLYCHHCAEALEPTHIEIIEDSKIILSERRIDEFDPAAWLLTK
jgi:hypothetical protein